MKGVNITISHSSSSDGQTDLTSPTTFESIESELFSTDADETTQTEEVLQEEEAEEANLEKAKIEKHPDEYGFVGLVRLCCAPLFGEKDKAWNAVRGYLKAQAEDKDKKKRTKVVGMRQGLLGNIPLHLACYRRPPVDVIKTLVSFSKESVMFADSEGDCAIHYACRNDASLDVLRELVNVAPHSIELQGESDQTPLHCLLGSASNQATIMEMSREENVNVKLPDIEKVRLLINPTVMNMCDVHTNTPFILFVQQCRNINTTYSNSLDLDIQMLQDRQNLIDMLNLFLEMKPASSSKLMEALKTLPDFLLKEALKHPYIQRIFNEKITQNGYFNLIVFDFYVHVLLIAAWIFCIQSFVLSSEEGVRGKGEEMWFHTTLRVLTVYLTCRSLIQIMLEIAARTSTIFIFNIQNIIKVASVWILLVTSWIVSTSEGSEIGIDRDVLNTLITLSSGIVWCKLFVFLKQVYANLSVFQCGMIHIFTLLIPQFAILGILIGAFGLMFYVDFITSSKSSEICSSLDDATFFFCSMENSYLKVFLMTLSTDVNEEFFVEHPQSVKTTLLIISFALTAIIVFLNSVIAVVTNSYNAVVRKKGVESFWYDRFTLLCEMEFMRYYLIPFNLHDDDDEDSVKASNQGKSQTREYLDRTWNDIMYTIKTDQYGIYRDQNLFGVCLTFCYVWLLRLFWISMSTIWFLIGFFTLGYVWPTELRNFFLCLSKNSISYHDQDEQRMNFKQEFRDFRRELLINMRDMYEDLNETMGQHLVRASSSKMIQEEKEALDRKELMRTLELVRTEISQLDKSMEIVKYQVELLGKQRQHQHRKNSRDREHRPSKSTIAPTKDKFYSQANLNDDGRERPRVPSSPSILRKNKRYSSPSPQSNYSSSSSSSNSS